MTTPSQISPPRNSQQQRGAAILIMVLILMLGLITLFTFRMDRRGPELEADRKTALALAQAKEALLGRAASNNDPGSLPCPSMNGTQGTANTVTSGPGTIECGNASVKSNFGWLPWKTLGLGELRDGSASLLWYMLGSGYVDKGTYSPPPKPLSPLTVTIVVVDVNPADLSETIVSSTSIPDIAAAIIAPGPPLPGQGRSGAALTDSSYSAAYFEGTANSVTDTLTIKIEQKRNHPLLKYNDQYLLVTNKEIIERSTPSVAQAIATELGTTYAGGYPPTGWLPSGGVWGGSGTYAQWVSPVTGIYPTNYKNTGGSTGEVRFDTCATVYSIQQYPAPVGAQVTRSGHC